MKYSACATIWAGISTAWTLTEILTVIAPESLPFKNPCKGRKRCLVFCVSLLTPKLTARGI